MMRAANRRSQRTIRRPITGPHRQRLLCAEDPATKTNFHDPAEPNQAEKTIKGQRAAQASSARRLNDLLNKLIFYLV